MAHDTRPGRNDPCPCGSGKKYKRCCLLARDRIEAARAQVRQTEGRVVGRILEWVEEQFGPELVEGAWADYLPEDGQDADAPSADSHAELEGAFIPWFLFNWIPDLVLGPEDGEETDSEAWEELDDEPPPLAILFAAAHENALEPQEIDFIREACSRPFGFHQILSVEPGQSLRLKELLTGEECLVRELTASRTAQRGEIVYARTLTLHGVSVMFGCAVQPLPPRFAQPLLQLRDALREQHANIGVEALHALADPLRETYWAHVAALRQSALPILSNTDGELIEPTTLRFTIDASPEETLRALAPLAFGHELQDLLEAAERDSGGSITRAEIPWCKPGNAAHAHWDNTVLGTLTIEPGRLGAEVNSKARAQRLRAELENRLGERARFESETTQTMEELRADLGRSSAGGSAEKAARDAQARSLESQPEVQALLATYREEHWRDWLDHPLPALADQTPREAARSEAGRERLETLFLEFEWYAQRGDNPLAPDIPALRRALGLPEPA
jgi:hypothetical protein